jgi:hypothetical protein
MNNSSIFENKKGGVTFIPHPNQMREPITPPEID